MAGETVRDVVINIRLNQIDSELRTPDFAPINQALTGYKESSEETAKAVAEAFDEASGSIADSTEDAIKAPDTSNIKKALADYKKSSDNTAKAVAEDFDKTTDAIDDTQDSVDDLADKLEEAEKKNADAAAKMTDDSLRVGEGFKAAGEGAFTLARGIAFMGTSSDEEFEKVVQKIAKVQGAFDLFKGTTETIKGVVEGTRALRLVLGGTAAANTAVATTNTAVATTGAAAATSMGALTVALGPLAIGVAAVAAAFFFFSDADEDIDDTTDALKEQARVASDLAEQYANIADAKQSAAEADIGERAEIRRFGLLKSGASIEQQITSNRELQVRATERMVDALTKIPGGRFIEIDEVDRTTQGIERFADEQKLGLFKIELVKGLQKAKDAQVESDKRELQLIEKQGAALERNLTSQQAALDASKRQLEVEQRRVQSLDELVGRLEPAELARLKILGEKVESGNELTKAEVLEVERLGGAGTREFAAEKLAGFGRGVGGAGVLDPFGKDPARGEDSLSVEIEAQISQQEAGVDSIVARIEEVGQTRLEQFGRIEEALIIALDNRKILEAIEGRLNKRTVNHPRN